MILCYLVTEFMPIFMSAEPPAVGQSDRHGRRVAPGSDGAQKHSYAAGMSMGLI